MLKTQSKLQGIPLYYSNDRLGTNILYNISSFVYAHKFNLPLLYSPNLNTNSIFLTTFKGMTASHNKNAEINNSNLDYLLNYESFINKYSRGIFNRYPSELDFYGIHYLTCTSIKQDYFSYFRNKLLSKYSQIIQELARSQKYKLPFDPKKTICIHVRLGDVNTWQEGSHAECNDVFVDYLNKEDMDSCRKGCKYRQAPIRKDKLISLIKEAKAKYPNREIVTFTNPGHDLGLPYRCLTSNDQDLDLYLLCQSEVLISSRSTFGMIPLLFNNLKEAWIPKWCVSAVTGLNTKFDLNSLNTTYY